MVIKTTPSGGLLDSAFAVEGAKKTQLNERRMASRARLRFRIMIPLGFYRFKKYYIRNNIAMRIHFIILTQYIKRKSTKDRRIVAAYFEHTRVKKLKLHEISERINIYHISIWRTNVGVPCAYRRIMKFTLPDYAKITFRTYMNLGLTSRINGVRLTPT